MRKEKKTVVKQLSIEQDYRYCTFTVVKKLRLTLKIWLNCAIFSLKCGAVAPWCSGAVAQFVLKKRHGGAVVQ